MSYAYDPMDRRTENGSVRELHDASAAPTWLNAWMSLQGCRPMYAFDVPAGSTVFTVLYQGVRARNGVFEALSFVALRNSATADAVLEKARGDFLSGEMRKGDAAPMNFLPIAETVSNVATGDFDAAYYHSLVDAPLVIGGIRSLAPARSTLPEFGPNTLGAAQAPRYVPGYGWADRAYWRLVRRLQAGESVEAPTLRVAAELRRDAFPELVRSRYRGSLSEAPDLYGTYDWHNPHGMIHPGPHQSPHIQIKLQDGTVLRIEVPQ